MKKIIVTLGMLMAFASASQADHGKPMVKIENIDKVIVKKGMSHKEIEKHVMHAMKCMLMLKKYDSAEDAIEAKMAKINAKCQGDQAVMPAKKCDKIKKHMAMKIKNCFTKAEFIKEFFKSKTEAAVKAEVDVKASAPAAVEAK